jgi:hypothetical protein
MKRPHPPIAWPAEVAALVAAFALVLAPLASGGAPQPTAPVFGDAKPVVPFTADDVGAATEMESGDLNGDGLADVVVTRITYPPARVTHPVGIFLANGQGGFTDGSSMWDGPPAQSEWGRQILIADFNGDHRNDIFVADTGYDADPFPGHQNALALSTPQGKLVDATAKPPTGVRLQPLRGCSRHQRRRQRRSVHRQRVLRQRRAGVPDQRRHRPLHAAAGDRGLRAQLPTGITDRRQRRRLARSRARREYADRELARAAQ